MFCCSGTTVYTKGFKRSSLSMVLHSPLQMFLLLSFKGGVWDNFLNCCWYSSLWITVYGYHSLVNLLEASENSKARAGFLLSWPSQEEVESLNLSLIDNNVDETIYIILFSWIFIFNCCFQLIDSNFTCCLQSLSLSGSILSLVLFSCVFLNSFSYIKVC